MMGKLWNAVALCRHLTTRLPYSTAVYALYSAIVCNSVKCQYLHCIYSIDNDDDDDRNSSLNNVCLSVCLLLLFTH